MRGLAVVVAQWTACLLLAWALTACNERPTVGFPPSKDVQAMVESKPAPTEAILTDPGASARYNAAVEAAFDRVHSAAAIVCRNLVKQGMAGVECPGK